MNLGVVLRADGLISRESLSPRKVETSTGIVDRVFSTRLSGTETHFLYGRFPGMRTPSWQIPFEENQAAFDTLGVDHVIGTFVVGGVAPHVEVGDLVIPHDLVALHGHQRTMSTPNGFTNVHVIPSLCPALRNLLLVGAREADVVVHDEGIYFSFYGQPRIETLAELRHMERLGMTIVGQTMDPEFAMARQSRCHYAAIAVAIDSHHNMVPEAAQDPDRYRQTTVDTISSGRQRMEIILEAALQARAQGHPDLTADCTCRRTRSTKHRNMFLPYPEELM